MFAASISHRATLARVTDPRVSVRVLVLACAIVVAATTSEAEDWQPVTLVVALTAALVIADMASVETRRIRISVGLVVQTVIMAVLGPGPAVAAAVVATLVEGRVNRVSALATLNNLAIFSVLGVCGGLLFEILREALGIARTDTAYAVLAAPVYIVLAAASLLFVIAFHPTLAHGTRLRVIRETALPSVPFELVNAILTAVAVFVWGQAGLAAAAALVLILAVMVPLARAVANALVSDERAAEVARLSLDRDRLLGEALDAERRERTRLAESLHDGPMQRLTALRQDAAGDPAYQRQLDATIAETRAIISAFHPAMVRELGFEASLRAAVAPFPAARDVGLTVRTGVDDRALGGSLLLPIAQELVVNAVKHASPTTIAVDVARDGDAVVLEVNDDGVGIDTRQAGRAVQAGHVGLAMVRRRVEDAGGQLVIATRPDGGTRSRVVLPAPMALA
jgi:signal transduction histidine kinase